MKYKIVLLLSLLTGKVFSSGDTNRINVFLGFNECINCYSALSYIESLHGYEKNLIIRKEDSLVALELLENYQLPGDIRYVYVSDAKWVYAHCKVYVNKLLRDSFPMVQLPQRIGQLNDYVRQPAKPNIKAFQLPKNTTLKTDRISMSNNGAYINVYDYILNKNIVFALDLKKDTLKKLAEVKGARFPQKIFLRLGGFDSTLYEKCLGELKSIGKANAHIEGSYLKDSIIYTLLNFLYVRKSGRDTLYENSFFIYQHNFITGRNKLSYVNDSAMKKKYDPMYYIDNTKPFFVEPKTGTATFSLYDQEPKGKFIYLLFNCHYNGTNYEFKDLGTLKIDTASYRINEVDKFRTSINQHYYFSIKLKVLIDYPANTLIRLKNFALPDSAVVCDVTREKDILSLLIVTKNTLEIVNYDLKNEKLVSHNRQAYPPDCSDMSLNFYGTNHIIFLSRSSPKLYLMNR